MKLKDQVCTLEQSKRLIELGIEVNENKQEEGVAFYHVFDSGMKWRIAPEGYFDPWEEGVETYPAFTVSEIGLMLAFDDYISQNINRKEMKKGFCCTRIEATMTGLDIADPYVQGATEAEARANMLIHVLEKNLVTADECNRCLISS